MWKPRFFLPQKVETSATKRAHLPEPASANIHESDSGRNPFPRPLYPLHFLSRIIHFPYSILQPCLVPPRRLHSKLGSVRYETRQSRNQPFVTSHIPPSLTYCNIHHHVNQNKAKREIVIYLFDRFCLIM